MEMEIDKLLNKKAKERLLSRAGEEGIKRLLKRWNRLSKRLDLQLLSRSDLGVYSALLTVLYEGEEVILKICTLPDIFSGQNEALALAPKGSTAKIIHSFPEEESWLMEKLDGVSGKSGEFTAGKASDLILCFQEGRVSDRLFHLVSYHMDIAERVQEETVLHHREHFIQLNETAPQSLVHGDLLPENIIINNKDREKMWLIDPTGYKGDPSFDFATLALYSKDPLKSLHTAAERFGEERIFTWAFLRATLSAKQSLLANDLCGAKPLLRIIPELKNEVPWLKGDPNFGGSHA